MIPFFSKLPPCLIGMEACGTSHHCARDLVGLGHEVRLMPPAYVKPYVKRGKTDDIPKGITNALAFVRRAVAGKANEVPDLATKVIGALAEQAIEVQGRIRQLERDLLASYLSNELARRIATVPGVC